MSKKARLYTALVAIGVLNLGLWSLIGVGRVYAGRILPGTVIHGQSLAGLTPQEAAKRLSAVHTQLQEEPITLVIGGKNSTATLAQLGYEIDTQAMVKEAITQTGAQHAISVIAALVSNSKHTVPTKLIINEEQQKQFITNLQQSLASDAKDISLDYTNGTIVVTQPEMGMTIDLSATEEKLDTSISQAFDKNNPAVALPIIEKKPVILEEAQIMSAKSQVEKIVAQPLSLKTDDQTFQIPPETLFSFIVFTAKNNQLEVAFDQTKIKSQVDTIAKKINVTPLAKKVSTVNNVTLTEGRDGRRINTNDAVNQIVERLKSATFDPPIALAAEKIERQTVTEAPEYELGRVQGKYVEVDLSSQRLYLISDQTIDLVTAVSTGTWSTPTPIGEFTIKNHIRTAWSSRYKLYMPFWMAIKKESGEYDGYGIHGLPYWPNGFVEGESHIGRPASHGCIRVGTDVVQFVYDWIIDGTKVYIHE